MRTNGKTDLTAQHQEIFFSKQEELRNLDYGKQQTQQIICTTENFKGVSMRMKRLAVLVSLPLVMVACSKSSGGGSGSGAGGSVTPGSSISSQFIDAPVKGLKYSAASGTGETGAQGAFNCKSGEEVTFNVKGKTIGKANCGEKIYIYDLDGTDDQKDAAAMLIQSLAQASNGILDLSLFNASTASVTAVDLIPGTIEAAISGVIASDATLGAAGLAPVTLAAAQAHVIQNLPDGASDTLLASIAGMNDIDLSLVGASSNSADHCWKNVNVKVKLDLVGSKAYRFNVLQYLAFDGDTIPASPTCDSAEHEDNGEYYQCITNPVRKIMTGRTVSGAHYEAIPFNVAANAYIACQYGSEYEVSDSVTEQACGTFGGTPVSALDAHNMTIDLGWNFGISVTDSSFTISFSEQAVNFVPAKQVENKVNLVTEKIVCNYSFSETYDDVGGSEPE